MRGFLFQALTSAQETIIGPIYRRLGRKLYAAGTSLHGQQGSEDRLVPSLRYEPDIQAADFIAPNATILGNVSVGFNSSVWYGSTLIGTNKISIGQNSVVQDRVHISKQVQIGNNSFVGPNCILQGSTIQDWAFIAMGSTVHCAKVESGSLVAAGAVISDNVTIKEGEIWAGNPGKFLRNLTGVQREILRQHLQQMRDLAIIHSEETQKNAREVISGATEPYQINNFEKYLEDIDYKFEYDEIDQEFAQRRSIMREKITAPNLQTDYEAFEYNVSHMGQKFNVGKHDQEFKKVATKIKKKERFDSDTNPWTKPY